MTDFLLIKAGVLLLILTAALYYDLRERKIKNFITIPGALAGLALNILEQGGGGVWFALQGWLVPVAVLMVLYFMNLTGAGDIKLFAAIGALMGVDFVIYSFVFSVMIGGCIALAVMIRERVFWPRMAAILGYFRHLVFTRTLVPYESEDHDRFKLRFSVAIVPGTIIQLGIYGGLLGWGVI